jgi:putative transposase
MEGKTAVMIDRWYPSTKTCSGCGNIQDMKLSDRVYRCDVCGLVIDRDLNSAYNILKEGIGQEVPEYKPVEIPLSGDQSIDPRYVSMKQEQDPTIIAGGCYGL